MKFALPSFGPKKLATSDEVAGAIAQHDSALAAGQADFDKVMSERHAALLGDDDAALDAIDRRARDAKLNLDRLQARREALQIEHREMTQAEAMAALGKQRDGAHKRASAARAWISKEYPRLARDLVKGLRAIEEAEREVRAVNQAHEAAGLPAPLQCVEPRQRMEDGVMLPAPVLVSLTRLVEIPGEAPGFGHISDQERWAAGLGIA